MRSRCSIVLATDQSAAAPTAPVSVRLGSLSGVFKAHCARSGQSASDEIRDLIAHVVHKPDALTLKAPIEDERIRVGLGPLKAEFAQWCKGHGLKTSAAIRMLVAHKLEQLMVHGDPALRAGQEISIPPHSSASQVSQAVQGEPEMAHETSRMRLRLKPSEQAAISALAEQRKVSAQRLATQVLRAFLLKAAVFSQQETVEMGAINLSLMRIGSNLNQIARQLNAHAAGTSSPGQAAYDEFEAMNQEIRLCIAQLDTHVRTCAHALALSRERWRIELRD